MLTDKFPNLRAYLRTLDVRQQVVFAKDCGTTLGYLRKFLSKGGKMDVGTVARMVANSSGRIPAAELRPDVNWSVFESHQRSKPLRIRKAKVAAPVVNRSLAEAA